MNQTSSKPADSNAARVPVLLDCDQILNHAGGDPELLLQLCSVFLNEIPVRIASLDIAIERRNGVERALQQLRNSLAMFGTGQLSYTAELVATALREGRRRQLRSEWRRLQHELKLVVPQVQRLMLELSQPRSPVQ